jgi:hypothetical protein
MNVLRAPSNRYLLWAYLWAFRALRYFRQPRRRRPYKLCRHLAQSSRLGLTWLR